MRVSIDAGYIERNQAYCITAAYCASKSAVISLTRSDAIDVRSNLNLKSMLMSTQYSSDNIRVNCVCPGLVQCVQLSYSA